MGTIEADWCWLRTEFWPIAMSVILFDLNALVPNLSGAFREGVSAAFRTFDLALDEDMSFRAVGKTYAEGVRAIYRAELGMPLPEQKRLDQLGQMYENVVRRFVSFSSSLFASPRAVELIGGLRTSGCQIGLVTDLDAMSLVSLMSRLEWDATSLFDSIVTGDGPQTKDEMLAVLLGRLEPRANGRRIFVGTTAQDALPAHLLGCDRILMLDSEYPRELPQKEEVKYETFHSMTDLSDLLRNPSLESAE